ncbi:hypothetical protein NC652_036875 [Populus alba x Populus x berolinensis]|nr:hypothetical protein NC652_036875 [Populus alba x Populus x berolinensis]
MGKCQATSAKWGALWDTLMEQAEQ